MPRGSARPSAFPPPLSGRRAAFELYLENALRVRCPGPERLTEAMRYAALSEGKRLRPLLTLACCEAVGGRWRGALPAAAAIECVHAFSLVHDDLPAMDDDDLRRGRPSVHREFDEATAILAGDALLAFAFQELTRMAGRGLAPGRVLEAVRRLAEASGSDRLIGGQSLDLAFGEKAVTELEVFQIHRRKTGALFGAAMALGGIAGGASRIQVDALESAGRHLGLGFQIQDDLLDEPSAGDNGAARSGSASGKPTYPRAVGAERARTMAHSHLDLSLFILEEYRLSTNALEGLIAAIAARTS